MANVLTEAQELSIYDEVASGRTKAEVARKFHVSPRTVGRVIDRVLDRISVVGVDDGVSDPNDWAEYTLDIPEREYVFTASPSQISITILEDGMKVDTVMATKDHPNFREALDLVFKSVDQEDNAFIEKAIPLLSVKQAIIEASMGRAVVEPETSMVYYITDTGDKVPFQGKLVAHLLMHANKNGLDSDVFGRLMKFADKLSQNPSNNMLTRLYDFLVGVGVSINEDGDVVCYKKVKADYTDVYSGKFDNSPGKEVKVDRNQVDENMYRTCSNGLHVCAASYLPHYAGQRVVKVTFDPRDAVSCPPDYDDAKLRLCRYQVISDVTDEFM